jgi:hypothetical protein
MASILNIFLYALLVTLAQLVGVFGVIFLLGTILYFISRFTRRIYVRSIGYKFDVVFTGWIGIPVHEIGHALFCIIFRHRINEIKLYTPSSTDGTLGYVNHSYSLSSRYQKIGNFFIGVGPILLGTIILYLLFSFFVSASEDLFRNIQNNIGNLPVRDLSTLAGISKFAFMIIDSIKQVLNLILIDTNLKNPLFYIFIYVSFSISSHMELSWPDLKGAWYGFRVGIVTLFLINLIALIVGLDFGYYMIQLKNSIGGFVALLLFAVVMSLINYIVSYIITAIYYFIRHRRILIPIG